MRRNKIASIILIGIAWVVLALGYTNCSGGFSDLKGLSFDQASTGGVPTGTGSAAQCEADLFNVFTSSYYPTLKTTCAGCHGDGGVAPPKFASADSQLAYNTFKQLGPDLINSNATSTTHAAPTTGPQNATAFNLAKTSWNTGQTTYSNCMANLPKNPTGTVPIPTSDTLDMNPRNIPQIYYNAGVAQTIEWDMVNDVQPATARFNGDFDVDIRVVYQTDASGTQTAIGYGFSNPRVKLLVGELELYVDGLIVKVNGQPLPGTELFGSAKVLARGIDFTNIYSGEVIVPMAQVSSSDQISFSFRYFKERARTDNPPTPPTPNISLNGAYTNNVTVGISTSNDGTARRWCVTASPIAVKTANDPCPGYMLGTTNGWSLTRPTSVNLSTLGRNPNSGETVTVYYWLVNSDLKVNATPGTATIIFDSTKPAGVTFSSVTLSSTQIADINGLTDSDEPVQWCVNVSPSQMLQQGGCMGRYQSTKPSFVGLPYNGTNYVSVWVRDMAGNETRAMQADVKSVVNTYGRIDFQQLTTGGTARSLFQTNCASCHASGMAQASFWNESDYLDTEAKKLQIYSEIDGSPRPMPQAGLLAPRDRALIKLWIDQTARPLQVGP